MKPMETSMTMTSGVGSPFYMAPELIMNAKQYTNTVDVYSFGIMAAQVIVGKLVYDADEFSSEYGLFSSFFLQTIIVSYSFVVYENRQHFTLKCAKDFDRTSLDALLK